MKNFTVPADVQAQLKDLVQQIHAICLANDVPYVSAYVLTSQDNTAEKAVSGLIVAEKDLAPDFLIAANEILTAPTLQAGLFRAVIETRVAGVAAIRVDDFESAPDQCPCPECDLARSAAQPDEPEPTNH